jgi:hypothetical protein
MTVARVTRLRGVYRCMQQRVQLLAKMLRTRIVRVVSVTFRWMRC